MPLDPFTALSLAATIVQFVDFSTKVISKGNELRTSHHGALAENIEVESVSLRLRNLADSLRVQTQHPAGAILNVREDEALEEICNSCVSVAEELIDRLNKLKVSGSHPHRQWKSFRQALKSVWSKEELETIQKRLKMFKDDLHLNIVVSLRGQVDLLSIQQDRRFASLGIEMQKLMGSFIGKIREEIEETLLRSLRFPTMRDRCENLAQAHRKTFEWVFHDPVKLKKPWNSRIDWICTDNGVYWIQGKAGSGKSTLMRFISEHYSTVNSLRVWSAGSRLEIISYYFWASGVLEQRSQAGLLRSLLYDILDKEKSLLPVIFPEEWKNLTSRPHASRSDSIRWTLPNLQKAFVKLAEQASPAFKLCFLIDGLDEYEGDHREIAEFFNDLSTSSHIKFLLSSRPWPVFDDIFVDCPRLRLQDLTVDDIDVYVHDKLESNRRMHMLIRREPVAAQELISEIKQKASGVFLWVKIVIKSFINGLAEGDEISDLQKTLHKLPPDLEELYDHMFRSISPNHLEDASKMFQILRTSISLPGGGEQMNILSLEGAFSAKVCDIIKAEIQEEPESEDQIEEKHARYERFGLRLRSRTKGLLEVQSMVKAEKHTQDDDYPPISFLHRTVKDYIERRQIWDNLLTHTFNTDFDPLLGLLMYDLARLKRSTAYLKLRAIGNHSLLLAQQLQGRNTLVEVPLLSELNRIMSHWTSLQNNGEGNKQMEKWNNDKCQGFMQLDWECDFLSFAMAYDLPWYFDNKLASNISLVKAKSGLPFLAHALAWDRGLYIDSGPVRSPEAKISYLKKVLSSGADANVVYKNNTLWRHIIHYVHCTFKDWTEWLKEKPLQKFNLLAEETGSISSPYWIQVFETMLEFGADPTACCFHAGEEMLDAWEGPSYGLDLINNIKNHQHTHSHSESHSVTVVIKDVFSSRYPDESARLLHLIETKQPAGSKALSKKRKRRNKMNEGSKKKRARVRVA